MDNNFRIYLRYSDASHRLGGTADLSQTIYKDITKEKIFRNFMKVFEGENITIMADNCKQETIDRFISLGLRVVPTALGDSGSFRTMIDLAIKDSNSDNDVVYFVEDDYIHCLDSKMLILEGVAFGGYATLYDSLDKYKNKSDGGYNPFIVDGGETSKVIVSRNSHWKYTSATTNTFATTVKNLKEDYDIIMHFCSDQFPHPMDFLMFDGLWKKNRLLVNSIPGRSAHTGMEMPPFVNWIKILEEVQ